VALFLALVVAAGVTRLLYSRLQRTMSRGKLTQVVVAANDLRAGVLLTAEDLKLIDWPASATPPGSFSKTESVVGRPLIYPRGASEPVLERDLAAVGSGIGLSVKIPPGMRATSVRSNEIVGVAGFLYPGSRVDVLATYNVPGGPVTQTLLQDVEVLTAGEKIEPDPQGKPQTVNVVTLLLTPEDSQRLLLSATQGTIQFVLRSGADKQRVTLSPTKLDQLVGLERKPPLPAQRARKRAPPPKPPEVYILEVIQGEKRTLEKF